MWSSALSAKYMTMMAVWRAPCAIISPRLRVGYACKYCVILRPPPRRSRSPKRLLKIHAAARTRTFEYRRVFMQNTVIPRVPTLVVPGKSIFLGRFRTSPAGYPVITSSTLVGFTGDNCRIISLIIRPVVLRPVIHEINRFVAIFALQLFCNFAK